MEYKQNDPVIFREAIARYHMAKSAERLKQITDLENSFGLEWENGMAIQRVYQYTEMYGDPDAIVKKVGGLAVWADVAIDGGYVRKMEIRDTHYTHTKPIRHMDYVFLTIDYEIKPCKLKGLSSITGSAYYYPIGKQLTSGCHFIGASIVAFYVIKEYNEDRMGLEEARQTYDVVISELSNEWLKLEDRDDYTISMPLTEMYSSYVLNYLDLDVEECTVEPKIPDMDKRTRARKIRKDPIDFDAGSGSKSCDVSVIKRSGTRPPNRLRTKTVSNLRSAEQISIVPVGSVRLVDTSTRRGQASSKLT